MDRKVGEFISIFAKEHHPREIILILRGKKRKERIVVSEALIPPFPTFGKGFSSFSLAMMPMDLKVIGTAHSHPSGSPHPSTEDLNHMIGRVIVIIAYPYTLKDIHAYNSKGEEIPITFT